MQAQLENPEPALFQRIVEPSFHLRFSFDRPRMLCEQPDSTNAEPKITVNDDNMLYFRFIHGHLLN
jgi:hypothetical protein